MGRDRFESAFQNRLEFPSGTKLSARVNSDFARQRGGLVLQRSRLRTGHAQPLSARRTREKEEHTAAHTEKVCVCVTGTHMD